MYSQHVLGWICDSPPSCEGIFLHGHPVCPAAPPPPGRGQSCGDPEEGFRRGEQVSVLYVLVAAFHRDCHRLL